MLEIARVSISDGEAVREGRVGDLFEFLDNTGGLTEEFLYQHQPVTQLWLNVYATNRRPIGRLDVDTAIRFGMAILTGPVVVVARKGYAGRLFVVRDAQLVVQEDAYAIRPKGEYVRDISLDWFAAHYTQEFQAMRTSEDGIGDFPRTLLRRRTVRFPDRATQDRIADIYQRRDRLMEKIKSLPAATQQIILQLAAE